MCDYLKVLVRNIHNFTTFRYRVWQRPTPFAWSVTDSPSQIITCSTQAGTPIAITRERWTSTDQRHISILETGFISPKWHYPTSVAIFGPCLRMAWRELPALKIAIDAGMINILIPTQVAMDCPLWDTDPGLKPQTALKGMEINGAYRSWTKVFHIYENTKWNIAFNPSLPFHLAPIFVIFVVVYNCN